MAIVLKKKDKPKTNYTRKLFSLTPDQVEILSKIKAETGINQQEIVRQLVSQAGEKYVFET